MKRLNKVAETINAQEIAYKIYGKIEKYLESNYDFSDFQPPMGFEEGDNEFYTIKDYFPILDCDVDEIYKISEEIAEDVSTDIDFKIDVRDYSEYVMITIKVGIL